MTIRRPIANAARQVYKTAEGVSFEGAHSEEKEASEDLVSVLPLRSLARRHVSMLSWRLLCTFLHAVASHL